jgi:glutamate racemase
VTQNSKKILQNAPIGVFDSGIGGLTVLKALRHHFPNESYIYLGDTARLPYGTKSPETVARYASSLTQELIKQDVKAIVIACNTASTHGMKAVEALVSDIPVIGMIEPAAKAAIAATRSQHIGVMATFGTIKSRAYTKALLNLKPDCKISPVACQMLVALAEEGWAEGDIARSVIHRYLDPVFNHKDAPDTLILGCTHFPVFEGLLKDILGNSVTLINSGEAASLYLSDCLEINGNNISGKTSFLVTDDPNRFAENAVKFYDKLIKPEDVKLIDIKG